MPTCSRCGTLNPDHILVCASCGADLSPTAQIGEPADRILETARGLYQRLGVEGPPLDVVSWQDMYYGRTGQPNRPFSDNFSRSGGSGRLVSPDFPTIIKNKVLLKPMMKGRLEPEEWTPLLASSIIFYKQLRGQNNRGSLLRFSPMLIVLGIFLALLAMGPGLPITPVEYVIFGVVAIPAIGIISLVWVMQFSKSLGLLADRKAAEVVGREQLLGVLEKISSMRQQDFQDGKRRNWTGYGNTPSLAKRVENLKSIPIYKTSAV